MSYKGFCEPPKSLGSQAANLMSLYSSFDVRISGEVLKVHGTLQPTSRSDVYTFQLKYSITSAPDVRVLQPVLRRNLKGEEIPHMFKQESLCLYYEEQFNPSLFLGRTIIPWANLWLYHYECWHATGTWFGGGIH